MRWIWLGLAGCVRSAQVEPFAPFVVEDDAHALIGAAGDAMGVGGLGDPEDVGVGGAVAGDPWNPPVPALPPATLSWKLQHLQALGEGAPMPATEVDRAIASRSALLRACYQRELARLPTLAGRLQVRITVDADGAVSRVEQLATTLGSPGVEACVRDRLASVVFRQPAGGGVVVGLLEFAPGEEAKSELPLP